MSFQGLNIIGSFTAGTNLVQGQANADRQRVDAYRSLLKGQVVQRKTDGTADDHIEINAATDRVTIGDAPEERRAPYGPFTPPNENSRPGADPATEAEEMAPEMLPTDRIDVIV
ncbi:hypothetical protein K2X85_07510 [bacterium]|jgi:hypothetical protein|nr:hypothetical protein [bacterium]